MVFFFWYFFEFVLIPCCSFPAAAQKETTRAAATSNFPIVIEDEDELPADIREQIARMEAGDHDPSAHDSVRGSAVSGGSSSVTGAGMKICPHCTFENTHGGNDCEVCGLPLS